MNATMLFPGVAGVAAECRGVAQQGNEIRIEEVRLTYAGHIAFICGRTITSLLQGAVLELDGHRHVVQQFQHTLQVPCRIHQVPYLWRDLRFPLSTEDETT